MRTATSFLLLLPLLAVAQPPVKDALDAADDKAGAVIEAPAGRQADPRTDTLHVFDRVDVMPVPAEGFLESCGPASTGDVGLEPECLQRTKVYVRFIVERDGRSTDPAVVKGACPSLDRLALECVKGSPRWKPGELDGVPVRVRMVVPVQFEPR